MVSEAGPSPASVLGRLTALIAAGFVCTRAVLDPDLWWHLQAGLDLLRIGHLTAVDPYSFTQDVPWINHEWLSEVIMALAYRAGGVFGLIVMKAATVAAACLLLASATRRAEETARWWLLTASIVALTFSATTIRPQLWTILAVALLLRLLPSRSRAYTIPVLFAVWANLHGGWIVGLAIAASWFAGRLIDTRSFRTVIDGAVAVVVGAAATLINPYGPTLWTFLLSTVRITRNLTEWQPVWRQAEPTALFLWALVAIGIVGTTLVWRWRHVTWAAALPVAWLAVMSLLVARIVPLFGEVAVACLAGAWMPSTPVAFARRAPVLLTIDAAVVAIVCVFNVAGGTRCLTTDRPWVPDVEAAAALSAPELHGRLVLPYDWGGFALWHWGSRLKVSIDPRRETVYSEAVVATQSAIRFGRPEGLDFLSRVRPEYVWEPTTTGAATEEWLRRNGYTVDVRTSRSFVARRSDLPALRPGVPLSRCFP